MTRTAGLFLGKIFFYAQSEEREDTIFHSPLTKLFLAIPQMFPNDWRMVLRERVLVDGELSLFDSCLVRLVGKRVSQRINSHKKLPKGARIVTSRKCCRMCAAAIFETAEDPFCLSVYYRDFDPGKMARSTVFQDDSYDRKYWKGIVERRGCVLVDASFKEFSLMDSTSHF